MRACPNCDTVTNTETCSFCGVETLDQRGLRRLARVQRRRGNRAEAKRLRGFARDVNRFRKTRIG